MAADRASEIWDASAAIADRVARGGKLILFGNGGSATDANDWALDCVTAARLAFSPCPPSRSPWSRPTSPPWPTTSARS